MLYHEMADFIKTLENDDNSIPMWLWEWRNRLVDRINAPHQSNGEWEDVLKGRWKQSCACGFETNWCIARREALSEIKRHVDIMEITPQDLAETAWPKGPDFK